MPIEIIDISIEKYTELLHRGEGHFLDFKSKNVTAARLTRSLSAFANADGGELYLGIEDGTEAVRSRWVGFTSVEDANGFIQAFEEFFPLGSYFRSLLSGQ